MSFCTNAKLEVLKAKIENDCCSMAFLSSVIKCAGQISLDANGRVVEIFTELTELYEKISSIVKQYYDAECELDTVQETNITQKLKYRITIPHGVCDRILMDCGIINQPEDKEVKIYNGITDFVVAGECCKRSYICGAFVSCATSNIVIKHYDNIEKNNSGYHLEFVFSFENLAEDFVKLLANFNIPSKVTKRKNIPLVYIKEYQLICDTLALVGAFKSVLELQNEAAIRDLRNNINRQTNCMNANLTKTVNASVRQLNAIKVIQENRGLESLNDEMMELCLIRLANPDESLENLRKLCSYPITKSGLNHRFTKLIEIAKEIEKDRFKISSL